MSLFQLSYKDYIKKITVENREKELLNRDDALSNIHLYPSHISDLSNSIEPIDNIVMYKKISHNKCNYDLQLLDLNSAENKHSDVYSELVGENSILIPIFKTIPTSDFLTGYYFAKLLIGQSIKSIDGCISFHFGCSDLQFITGIEKQLGKPSNKWKWFGADIKMGSPSRYLNGINKTGDLNNIDVIKSIRNQLSEVLKNKLSFYVSDVYPNLHQLYNSVIIPLVDVDKTGFSILRLPDLSSWYAINIHMINFMLLCTSHFYYVKIFHTPWGIKTRYYLILAKPKDQFTTIKYITLVKYLEELKELRKSNANKYPTLYTQSVFINDTLVEEFVVKYATVFDKLSRWENTTNPSDAVKIWFDLVMCYKV
jgi:hypothetical protein